MADKRSDPRSFTLETILKERDAWRERTKRAPKVVRASDRAVDNNQMGVYRWYIHPDNYELPVRSAVFFTQEIPPGGHSGKEKNQGGRIHYVMEGKGYIVVDGVKHDWKKGDLVMVPIKPEGTVHQLFNSDPANPAMLAAIEPNWYDCLGPDMGSGLEILENASTYKP